MLRQNYQIHKLALIGKFIMAQTDFSDMADKAALRKTLGHFPTGVAIATTMTLDNQPTGLTISSFNSVSLDPPLILFSIDLQATCLSDFRQNGHFAINILSAEQTQLCRDFATPDIPRFAGKEFHISSEGTPLLADVSAYLVCAVEARHPAGDHELYIGRVLRHGHSGKQPLIYGHGQLMAFPQPSQ